MHNKAMRESTSQWVNRLGATLTGRLPASESNSLIRGVFAALLLLRWTDQQEAEQETMAVFEDRTYRPLLPPSLQWRRLVSIEHSQALADRLHQLAGHVQNLRGDPDHPMAAYLLAVADPLRRLLNVFLLDLIDVVRWIEDLPFETPSERRALLEVFDQVMDETGNTFNGHFSTPSNIARLVCALAKPQPGERIYDPCFGYGNLLVGAWQHAEQSSAELRCSGPLLEVAGVEINPSAFLIGLTRMLLAGIYSPRLERGDSLERESLSNPGRQGFDLVLANPPIGAKSRRGPVGYQHFPILTSDNTGLFVQHVLSQLRSGGRAIIAVPEGFLFRSGAERELRRSLLEKGQVEAVIGLPAGAFAPYTSVKGSLLMLSKQGGATQVRMADASTLFDQRSSRKAPRIPAVMVEQLVTELQRVELRNPRELPPGIPEGRPGIGVLSRSVWEVNTEDLAAVDWDLSPRRREKGGLNELLINLKDALGDAGSLAPLSKIANVFAGRSIKSADLMDKPPFDHAVGYVRIKDLTKGKVGRVSSWLKPELAQAEQQWALLPGDVLMSKSGTIGKAAVVRNGAVGSIAARGLYVLRADQERLDSGFLLAYLASPICQNWLSAQSRGSVVQHLNRAVLDDLPVPLPPLALQVQAAAQFKEFGTDALTFLSQAMGSTGSDRISAWLAKLDGQVPKFASGLDGPPSLSLFEPIAALASEARNWLAHDQVSSQAARWLAPMTQALLPLTGVSQIPDGPGLLNVLQETERRVQMALEKTNGHLPAESQARAIGERLRDWLRVATADLAETAGLQVRSAPASLPAGSFSEFSLDLENLGSLPLRNVRVETQPDWGVIERSYVAEQSFFSIPLQGDVPKKVGNLSLRLVWQARSLTGELVNGEIELAIRVAEPDQEGNILSTELGSSPYVTGSPLEPQHGHPIFFGREELIGKISRQISNNGNVVLLEGNRRAGKTSVLKHLEGNKAIPGWLAVYSSLQGAEGASQVVGVPTEAVFREISRSTAMALTKLQIEVPLPNGQTIAAGKQALGVARACREGIGTESPFADFRDYLEVVLAVLESLNLGLVLMLDEFDKLQEGIDNGVTSPQVPENIRFLIQTYPKFSAVLTGSRRLKRLREEYWSALYGLGTSIPVTALDTASARKVVTEPVRNQLTFSKEAIDQVISVTARHPYLMQCLCNRVFDYAVQTKSRSITTSVVNEAATGLVRDNEHFASLWDYAGLGPETGRHRRQLIMLLCAQSFKQGTHIGFGTLQEQLAQAGVDDVFDEDLDADLTYLRELELIELSGEIGDGEYCLTIPLMADWIKQHQDADVVASRASAESEEDNA